MRVRPKNFRCNQCGRETYKSYDGCDNCGAKFSFESIKRDDNKEDNKLADFMVSIRSTHVQVKADDEHEAEDKGFDRLVKLIEMGVIKLEVKKI
jgi:predicted ATP-dependent serine protease